MPRGLLACVGLLFFHGMVLGIEQAGAEWGYWDGPRDCAGANSAPSSVGDLLSGLRTTVLVSCTEASWRFLGLSFAGWNVVAMAGLGGAALWASVAGRDVLAPLAARVGLARGDQGSSSVSQ